MTRAARSRRRTRRRGVILIIVLLVLTAVVGLTLGFARDVRVETAAAGVAADDLRLQALVDSALARAMAELRRDQLAGDGLADAWRDNENELAGVVQGAGRYWLLLAEPDPGDGREVRYGIRDEASRLDVNFASEEQLLALPGITDQAVHGILDWRDDDDDPRDQGAEATYYATLDPPYLAKNAPFESLDELLRVRGVDAAMLYGEDRNRNGVIDPGEDDGDRSFPPDDADGELDRGLIDYLTLFSRNLNRTADGRARLDVNSSSPQEVDARLQERGVSQAGRDWVQLVIQGGGGQGGGGQGGGGQGGGGGTSLGALVASQAVSEADAAVILEELTVTDAENLPGRINVNTAPREVLLGLPGLDEELVDAILTRRLEVDSDLSSPAWLLRVLDRETFSGLADLVTARSDQFLIHIVALLEDRPRFRRVEALVDRTYVPVRVLTYRDVTGLGFPFRGERGEELP